MFIELIEEGERLGEKRRQRPLCDREVHDNLGR